MSDNGIVAAVYDLRAGAEEAVEDLQRYGFDIQKMSIVARNSHEEEHAGGGASSHGADEIPYVVGGLRACESQ